MEYNQTDDYVEHFGWSRDHVFRPVRGAVVQDWQEDLSHSRTDRDAADTEPTEVDPPQAQPQIAAAVAPQTEAERQKESTSAFIAASFQTFVGQPMSWKLRSKLTHFGKTEALPHRALQRKKQKRAPAWEQKQLKRWHNKFKELAAMGRTKNKPIVMSVKSCYPQHSDSESPQEELTPTSKNGRQTHILRESSPRSLPS